jgi:hypothetical protein
MRLADRLVVWRAERYLRNAARRRRREVWREMSQYTTPGQRDDLLATFDRYPDSMTGSYRDILCRQAVERRQNSRHWPAMRYR